MGRDHTIQCGRCGIWYGGLTGTTHECNETTLVQVLHESPGYPMTPLEPQISGIPMSKFGTHDILMERIQVLAQALRLVRDTTSITHLRAVCQEALDEAKMGER